MGQGTSVEPAVLLIGPYDPHCGEYTFLAPPLGAWRLARALERAGVAVKVFDPNRSESIDADSATDHIGSAYCDGFAPAADCRAVIDFPSVPSAESTG